MEGEKKKGGIVQTIRDVAADALKTAAEAASVRAGVQQLAEESEDAQVPATKRRRRAKSAKKVSNPKHSKRATAKKKPAKKASAKKKTIKKRTKRASKKRPISRR